MPKCHVLVVAAGFFCVLIASSAGVLAAQDSTVLPGSRVRLTVDGNGHVMGRLSGMDNELVKIVDDAQKERAVPRRSVRRIDVDAGRKSRALLGLAIGAGLGAWSGACSECDGAGNNALGAVAGAVAGAAIGSFFHHDTWKAARLSSLSVSESAHLRVLDGASTGEWLCSEVSAENVRVSVAPVPRGAAVAVAVRF